MDPDMSDIEQFKDFLSTTDPSDFQRTSAIEVSTGYPGPGGFARFIQHHLNTSVAAFEEGDGDIDPLIHLANEEEERTYEAYHDENNGQMFRRLHREAEEMGATMFFIAMDTPAAPRALELDGMDSAAVREALERGDLQMYFGWYAEQRLGEGEPDRRGGLWEVSNYQLGERIDGVPEVAPLFHSVLA